MLKIHFSKYSFGYFLLLIFLLFIGIVFSLKPYGENFVSYAFIKEEYRGLKIEFEIAKNDQKTLQALAKKVSVDWSGEELILDLNASQPILDYLDGLKVGLKPKMNSLEFGFEERMNFSVEGELSWNYTNFTPKEAVFYLESNSFKEVLKFPGSEVLSNLKNFALIGVSTNNNLEFALVGESVDGRVLQEAYLNLKKLASPTLNYIEGSFDDIKLTTLFSSPENFGYTFGLDRKVLIIASSPQAWINIYQTKNGQENIGKNSSFAISKLDLPKKGALNLFVNVGQVTQLGLSNLEKALKGYASLEISPELQESSVLSNIGSLTLVVKNDHEAKGTVLFK